MPRSFAKALATHERLRSGGKGSGGEQAFAMGEHGAGEDFRVRLKVVTRALARLDPRNHRTMIEDLEQLRERYQAELDRSGPEGLSQPTDERAKGDTP
jgi:hypothetical protein